MHRFFSNSNNISGGKILISDSKQMHHIRDVLRFETGDYLTVFDENGIQYLTEIENILAEGINLKIKNKILAMAKKVSLTIACAIPKRSKMDDIIDKLTQLGVDRIVPLVTKRVVTQLNSHKEGLRLTRWRKIAEAASLQSQRNNIPEVEPIQEIEKFLKTISGYDLKLIPYLEGKRQALKDILQKTQAKNILVLIGPEGDFTPEEVELAKKFGCIPISLGDLVLRVETAAVAVTAFLKFKFEL